MNPLANQIAVVTGAGRGIGRAIALKFAEAGADVVCVSRTAENAEKVAQEVRALGRRAWAHAVDVADSAAVGKCAETILGEAGQVDILVNNAGITKDGLLMRMSEADWDAVLDINLKGTFLFTKAFTRSFLKQRSGRIINIASVVGLIGNAGQCNYGGQQGRRDRLYQVRRPGTGLPRHHGQRDCPGFYRDGHDGQDQPEAARAAAEKHSRWAALGQPEDVAGAVLFLASPAARYITGQVLAVDGGMAM